MMRKKHVEQAGPPPDPFQERHRPALRERMRLMGGEFLFETDSPRLMRLVRLAYEALPAHQFTRSVPRCRVRLVLTSTARTRPPRVRPLSGAGILCGAMDGSNFVALNPQQHSALIVVSPGMLRFPYHVRYEILEFTVYVLASRVLGLVPLHAACVGRNGRAVLLLGESGSGKSTVSLHCLMQGFDFLAEDSVLVNPAGLLATGVANFLHIRRDSLRFIEDGEDAAGIRKSGMIRRRSGVAKLEIDLRHPRYRRAAAPLPIVAVVFVSPRSAGLRPILAPCAKAKLMRQLALTQQYAANQPGWSEFMQRVSQVPAFELRRSRHPRQAVEALKELLPCGPAAAVTRRARL